MNQHVFGGTDRSCASLCSSPRWPILAWIFVVPSYGAEFDCEAAGAVVRSVVDEAVRRAERLRHPSHLAGGEDRSELGAIGHGPDGAELADRITEHIRTWDQDRAAVPTLAVFPAGTPDRFTTRTVIDKRHTRLTFSW